MKRILIASLATTILLTACTTETTTESVPTTVGETVGTIATTISKIEPPSKPEIVLEVEPEPEELSQTYLGQFKLTAYCACAKCCGKSDGITATGTVATQGRTIAVDPRVIPYGSQVMINGHIYTAEDCGGSIKSNRIDVFFNSHTDALNFGVQYADVYLVRS